MSGTKYSSLDWCLLGIVLIAAVAIRTWLITHTEVMARDGVGLVRYARQLETEPWREVLRGNAHPPLYPLAIFLVSLVIRPFWPAGLTSLMQVSAQVASALGGIFLLIPVYALSKRLFNTRIAFWSTLFVACLPAAARVMSDALTESIFLFFVTLTLWLACRAFDGRPWLSWVMVGISGGLAYLARPEGVLALIAVGLVMIIWQFWRRDQKWIRLGWHMTGLCAGTVLAMAPYMLVIGGVTNKATGIDVLHAGLALPANIRAVCSPLPPSEGPGVRVNILGGNLSTNRPGLELLAAPLAVYWSDIRNSPRLQRICWSVWAVGTEIGKATNYSGWLPGFLGLYVFRRKFRQGPDSWLLPMLCGLQVLLLCRVAYVAGYVADRHVLLFLVCGAPWAVATVFAIGETVATYLNQLAQFRSTLTRSVSERTLTRSVSEGGYSRPDYLANPSGWCSRFPHRHLAPIAARLVSIPPFVRLQNGHGLCGAILTGLIVFPLPKTLEPLHLNRAGYHAAGQWLAQNAYAADVIIDPFSWAEYYSGRTLRQQTPAPPDHRPFQYIVLGCSDNEHVRLPLIPYAEELASQGETIFQWSPSRPGHKAEAVAIYRVTADPKAAGGRVEGRLTARPTGSKGP